MPEATQEDQRFFRDDWYGEEITGRHYVRCEFHEGYLDSLPSSEPFGAATSLLVSQFVRDPVARAEFFRASPGGSNPAGSW